MSDIERIFEKLETIDEKMDHHTEAHFGIEKRLTTVEEKTADLAWWKTTVVGSFIAAGIAGIAAMVKFGK